MNFFLSISLIFLGLSIVFGVMPWFFTGIYALIDLMHEKIQYGNHFPIDKKN